MKTIGPLGITDNLEEVVKYIHAEGLDKNSFIERLEHVVKPVYESAQMSGFREWIYDKSI